MAFVAVCKTAEIQPGGMRLLRVGKKSVLLVWPERTELRAYRGRCPHQDVPLEGASFDGNRVICSFHKWHFDADNGRCLGAVRCSLHGYPVQVVGDEVQVELAG